MDVSRGREGKGGGTWNSRFAAADAAAAAATAAAGSLIYARRRLCQWIYIPIFIIRNIIATRVYCVSGEYDVPAELSSSFVSYFSSSFPSYPPHPITILTPSFPAASMLPTFFYSFSWCKIHNFEKSTVIFASGQVEKQNFLNENSWKF